MALPRRLANTNILEYRRAHFLNEGDFELREGSSDLPTKWVTCDKKVRIYQLTS